MTTEQIREMLKSLVLDIQNDQIKALQNLAYTPGLSDEDRAFYRGQEYACEETTRRIAGVLQGFEPPKMYVKEDTSHDQL